MALTKVTYSMIDSAPVSITDNGAVADATFPASRGAAGGTDSSAAIQAAFDAVANYGTVYIPEGLYKLTTQITCNKPVNVICNGVFLCSNGGSFVFSNGASGNHVTSLTQVKISGLKLVYVDKDQTRVGIDVSQTQTMTRVEGCAITSELWVNGVRKDLFNFSTEDGFHSFCGIKTSKNYNVRVVDCSVTNCLTGYCFETSNDNWGNTQFENIFEVHCAVGWSMDSTDGVVGLSDSVLVSNMTANGYGMHNPTTVQTVTLDSAVSINDTSITITTGSTSAYDALQNVSGNAIVPVFVPSIGFVLYTNGRSGTTVSLARPATRAINTGVVLNAGTVGIITAQPIRPMIISGLHVEEYTHGYVACGTNGACVNVNGCLFSTSLQQNPVYLLGGENYNFINNVYENGAGTHPAFVRIALTNSSGGGGTGEYFKNVNIEAPATAYYDPSASNDENLIVAYDTGVTFRANTTYKGVPNWYKHSTYSPTLTCGTSGSITLDSNFNTLSYTKVNNLVTVTGALLVSSVSSPTGNIQISLPYTILDEPDAAGRFSGSVVASGVVAANVSDFVVYGIEGSDVMQIRLGNATTMQDDSAQEMQANSVLVFSVTYHAVT